MLEREERKPKKSSLLSSMLDNRVEEVSKENPREKNPNAYKRHRGKNQSKAMSYYLSEEIIGGIALKSIKEGISKSDVVRKALEEYLEMEIEELNILKSR